MNQKAGFARRKTHVRVVKGADPGRRDIIRRNLLSGQRSPESACSFSKRRCTERKSAGLLKADASISTAAPLEGARTMYNRTVADATIKAFFDFAEANEFALLCVRKSAKNPIGEGWQKLWSKNRADWELWSAKGFNIGVHAGASRLITFDLDSKHGGIEAVRPRFDAWCLSIMLPLPHHVETPSKGQHIFMWVPEGVDAMALART